MAIRYRDTPEQIPPQRLAEIEQEARVAYGQIIDALNRATDREMAESMARRKKARRLPRLHPHPSNRSIGR
jgi:hypothetical protein